MIQLESFRVLLVDDDVRLLESMEAVLADQFALRFGSSGREASRAMDLEQAPLNAAVQGDRK